MNPNMAFAGGGGGNITKNMDLRLGSIVIAACTAVILSFVADTYVFIKEPSSHLEAIISYTAILGYAITESRPLAFLFSFVTYFLTLALGGYIAFLYLEIYVIEPIKVKWKMIYTAREKKWMNKYDNGTI